MSQPKQVYQVWKNAEPGDEYGQSELVDTFYSLERAQACRVQLSWPEYQEYIGANAAQMTQAKQQAAAMTDLQIAYWDWEQAARQAPTKQLRVEASAMTQLIRAMSSRPELGYDWRTAVEVAQARSELSQAAWLERPNGSSYAIVPAMVADAEA